jgi:hypothetical protein
MDVRLSAYSIALGEPLTIKVGGNKAVEDTTQLGLQVFGVGEAETSFRLLITLPIFLERAR